MIGNIDVLPCGYVCFKDDGTITACNVTVASWIGYPREEIIGKSIETIFTLATRIFYNTHFFPLIKLHGKASEIFLSIKSKENQDVPVLANASRTIEDDVHLIHCVFIRVEQRKKFEQELLKARRDAENALKDNKQLAELSKSLEQHALELDNQYRRQITMNENLRQFGKIISHDLQEPIRKIQIFIDMISKDANTHLSPKSEVYSSKIDAAAEKLKALTASLHEYIAVDNEKVFSEVDVVTTIQAAKSRAANIREFSDFTLEIDAIPTIEGYKKQLELLFFHLIDNAIKFRSPNRKLAIKVTHLLLHENIFRMPNDQYKYTEHVRITFEDNGVGFSDEYRENVFLLLKKLDNSTAGLGIGLPLVKKIIHNHSGNVNVTTEQGKGTCFEIELPVKVGNE
ncbi:MAG TPA: PAS domain-containing sensor histidine kinase [Chryseosolibacter sp.]|nr:PAS domain-containing sensor histidine kinase [Chryseosolibacter sp.]